MSSATKAEPRAASARLIPFLGPACLIGGLLWLVFILAGTLGLPLGPPIAEGLLGVLLLVGLMGGPLGLLALRAAGNGRTGRLGRIGAIVALLGLFSYLVGHTIESVFGLAAEEIGIFYAAGALLVGLGMLPLGIAAILARRLPGWRRFTPFSVGLYYAAMIPVQVVFFIGPDGAPSMALLAFWGLTWALLGYAILSDAGRRQASRPTGTKEEAGR
jgi:hypothetical protein